MGCDQGTEAGVGMDTARAFFDLCESGKGAELCKAYIKDGATFACQAVDVMPGPPITGCKTVAEYCDWMAGVVKNFGEKASYAINASGFDEVNSTAIFVATFGGFSHYAYVITLQDGKVAKMTKIWNDAYAGMIMGQGEAGKPTAFPSKGSKKGPKTASAKELAQTFFDLCESGKGFEAVKAKVTMGELPGSFAVQATDALPGPIVTECTSIDTYCDWMKGVVTNMGEKATYDIDAMVFDEMSSTAIFAATFGKFSHYVYTLEFNGDSGALVAMSKVWNDQYAARLADPVPPEEVVKKGMGMFEEKYNANDMDFCGSCYTDECYVTVNGGEEAGGYGPFTTPKAVSAFLDTLRNKLGGTDMKFTVTGVEGHSHKDTWTAGNGTGACDAEWTRVEGAPLGWKIKKDAISFTPKEA